MKTRTEAVKRLKKQGYDHTVMHRGREFWQTPANQHQDLAEIRQTGKGWEIVLPYALAKFFYVTKQPKGKRHA